MVDLLKMPLKNSKCELYCELHRTQTLNSDYNSVISDVFIT